MRNSKITTEVIRQAKKGKGDEKREGTKNLTLHKNKGKIQNPLLFEGLEGADRPKAP